MNNPYVPTLINRGIMGFEMRVIKKTWLQDRVYNNDVIACHYNIHNIYIYKIYVYNMILYTNVKYRW